MPSKRTRLELKHSVMLRRFLVFSATMLLSIIGYAQNPNGALRGEVQDASGARVAGARIVVESMGSSITRETVANDHGEFRIEGLLPGSYHVAVTAKGFAEAAADVNVAVSVVRDIAVTLNLASGHETVNVQATPSSITTQTIDTSSAVRRRSWQPRPGVSSARRTQFRQHRLSRARNRASRAFRSYQGAHHRRLHRRKLWLE